MSMPRSTAIFLPLLSLLCFVVGVMGTDAVEPTREGTPNNTVPAREGPSSNTVASEPGKRISILLFWAVGTSPSTIALVQKNLAAARASAGRDCCEVFLAHYKGSSQDWPYDWYNREVTDHIAEKGFKFQLLRSAWRKQGKDWSGRYDFVWVLDEDIDFSSTDFGLQLQLAKESGALIVGPSLTQSSGRIVWQIQVPQPQCKYRYTNYVEVIAPMLRTVVLKSILDECENCIHPKSVWGLDGVWCGFAASHNADLVTPQTACAILDGTPVLHQNWKTLSEKYHGSRREDRSFRNSGQEDADDIEARYPKLYVTGAKQQTFKCVAKNGNDVAGTRQARKTHGLGKLLKSIRSFGYEDQKPSKSVKKKSGNGRFRRHIA